MSALPVTRPIEEKSDARLETAWLGGCRCGRTTIEISKPPLMASACHCSGCQKMTSSAFSLTASGRPTALR
jgi:hypothetical protein